MPNTTIGTVQVILSASHEKMTKAFGEAAKQVQQFKNDVVALVGAWASVATAKAIAGFVSANMEAVVSLQRQADQIGITVQAMGGLQHAAGQAGVGADQFAASMAKMQQAITQARHGNAEMEASLQAIGLATEDLKGKGTDEQLALIADHLQSTGDAGLRVSTAMKLFGDQGRALLPLLEQGSAGLQQAQKDAEALGLTFTEIDTGQVVEAKQVLTEVEQVLTALGERIVNELAPYITLAGNAFLNTARESGGFRAQVAMAVEYAVKGAVMVYDGWMRLREVWTAIRIGVMYMTDKVLGAVNNIIQTGQILSRTWNAAWELVKASTRNVIAAIVLDFDYLKSGIYNILDGIANAAGRMLEKLAMAATDINGALAEKLSNAAATAKLAMTNLAAQADKDAKNAGVAMSNALADVAKGWDDLKTAATTLPEGSAAIAQWRENLQNNMEDEKDRLAAQDAERLVTVARVEQAIVDVKSQAMARAAVAAKAHADQQRAAQKSVDAQEIEAERKKNIAKLQATAEFAGNIATLTASMSERNRAAFYVNKAAQMAQAEINAWMAYSNTLASPALISSPGLAEAFATTAFAAGQVAVASIAAQQPPGRADGGPVSRGGLYQVNERGPELLSIGDKSYLMMGGQGGHITPNGGASPGGSPKVEVHVHTPPGMSASTQQSTNGDGSPRIDVIIEAVTSRIAGDVANGTGPMARTMERTYGLNRSRGAAR